MSCTDEHGGRALARSQALDALARLPERQRALRRAYVASRYGWPESMAWAWARRPDTFGPSEPACLPSRFLEDVS
jgi:hypothetical protein